MSAREKLMQESLYTLVADYTMKGRLAYLSHQETLTLFERALVRAKIPLVFSGGFNPRPHLSIPLPRSVGVQSDAERICAVISAVNTEHLEAMAKAVAQQLPDGCVILNCSLKEGKATYHPAGFRMRFVLDEKANAGLIEHIKSCVTAQKAGQAVVIQRYLAKKDIVKPLDVTNYLERVKFENANVIDVRCRVTNEGTVRVDELMQWLNLQPEDMKEPARRTEVYWNTEAA